MRQERLLPTGDVQREITGSAEMREVEVESLVLHRHSFDTSG
jgi:hypothetical protein